MSAFDAWSLPPGAPPPREVRTAGGADDVLRPIRWPVFAPAAAAGLVSALAEGREALCGRTAPELARLLGGVGARFLDEDDPIRREALDRLPGQAGLSPAMARAVVDGMAGGWTARALRDLLAAEPAGGAALDGFVADPSGAPGRRVRALGPRLALHVCAGTVPGVSVGSLLRGLLVRSAVLLKPGRGDALLPVLFARALRESAPDVAGAVAVAYWPGGADDGGLEKAILAHGALELVVAYGGDSTVAGLRARLAPTVRLVAYHHRVSVGVVGRDALSGDEVSSTARAAARAVALFDQRGCVSPVAIWVEEGGEASPAHFAEALAEALAELHESLPPGPLDAREASAVHQRRGTDELRHAAGEVEAIWSGGEAPWTVTLEREGAWGAGCLARNVRVRAVGDLGRAAAEIARAGPHLQTVAVAGVGGPRKEALLEALAGAGATRIASFESAPWPEARALHDGAGPLAPMLRWVEAGTA